MLRKNEKAWNAFAAHLETETNYVDKYGRKLHTLLDSTFDSPHVSMELFQNGFRPTYPGGKTTALCVSHDIDDLFYTNKELVRIVLHNCLSLNLPKLIEYFKVFLNKRKSSKFNIKQIVELEKSMGFRSTFFFLALEKGELDFNYNLNEIADIINAISKEGFEIALHGSHKAFCDKEQMALEKNRLENIIGNKISGYRNHYLKFSAPFSWHILSQNKFNYDSTYGFADRTGFRNGMCYPFQPYDTLREEFIDIIEIPLSVMDCSLDRNMQLDWNIACLLVEKQIDNVTACQGVTNLLWHNTYFEGEPLIAFKRIVNYAKSKNAWICSCQELIDWWKLQGYDKELTRHLT
jgi:hypothetical protein